MPMLELGDLTTPEGRYRAILAVQAIMAWPKEERTRRGFLAQCAAYDLARLKQIRQTLPDPARAGDPTHDASVAWPLYRYVHRGSEQQLADAGDYASLVEAKGLASYRSEIEKRTSDWLAAGEILRLVAIMAEHHPDLKGGASVNKAMHILLQVKLSPIPRNAASLSDAWSSCSGVSHLCAAFVDLALAAKDARPDAVEAEVARRWDADFLWFLGRAAAYEKFGLHSKPKHGLKTPFLDPEETWVLPEPSQWPVLQLGLKPLTPRMLQAVRGSKSPYVGRPT